MAHRVELRRCNSLVAVGGITDIGMRWSRKARVQMTRRRQRLFGIFAVQLDPEPYSAGPKSLL